MQQNSAIEILKKLVSFRTFEGYPNKALEVSSLYDYVENLLADKYKFQRYLSNGRESLVVYSKSLKTPNIVLQSHIDVVPGPDSMFKANIIDNKLQARGASDMKYATAAFIYTLLKLEADKHDIALWLTSDEEIGSSDGVRYLLDDQSLRCNFCILPDGSNNHAVTKAAKGVLHVDIQATGISAHGSRPWEGVNAIDKLLDFYSSLKQDEIFNREQEPVSYNLGQINGGSAANSVPDSASMKLDFRFLKRADYDELQAVIKRLCSDGIESKVLVYGEPYELDLKNTFVENYLELLTVKKIDFRFVIDTGSSDARFFSKYDIPVLLHKPVCGGDHSENEWIDTHSLEEYADFIFEFVLKNA